GRLHEIEKGPQEVRQIASLDSCVVGVAVVAPSAVADGHESTVYDAHVPGRTNGVVQEVDGEPELHADCVHRRARAAARTGRGKERRGIEHRTDGVGIREPAGSGREVAEGPGAKRLSASLPA